MRQGSRWIGPVVTVALALPLALAGCAAGGSAPGDASATPSTTPGSPTSTTPAPDPGGSQTPAPPPPSGSAMSRVTVTRTGGIAGVSQSLRVEPNGSWIFVDRRPVAQKTGRLTAAELRQLVGLVTNAAFAREARMGPPVGTCSDSFIYTVTVGEFTTSYDDCAAANDRPTTAAVIDMLVDATPL